MTRLPRTRKGKTPIDVTTTNQGGLARVRISIGKESYGKVNSDLDQQEVTDLLTMLTYHLGLLTGQITQEPDQKSDLKPVVAQLAQASRTLRGRTDIFNDALDWFNREFTYTASELQKAGVLLEFIEGILTKKYITAIKLHREATGTNLAGSKYFVDNLSLNSEMMTYTEYEYEYEYEY